MKGEAQIRGWKTRKRNKPTVTCKKRGCSKPATSQRLITKRTLGYCKSHYHKERRKDAKVKSVWNPLPLTWEGVRGIVDVACPICGSPPVYGYCPICGK